MATTSTQRFHSRCGENINLSDNNTVARRIQSWNTKGIVFTEQPVALGTVFQVKILVYDANSIWSGSISIGMTTQCPDDIEIPTYAVLGWSDHSDYWILAGTTVYHNREERKLKVNLNSLREGQTVGCMVSREGELHVYIDGVDKGIVWTGLQTHKPFWGVADVYGRTKKMQLLSSDINHHATDESVPLYCQLSNKLSITKPQEPPTIRDTRGGG